MARETGRSSGAGAALVGFKRLCELKQTAARAFAKSVIGAHEFQGFFLAEDIAVHRISIIRSEEVVLLDAVKEVLNGNIQCFRKASSVKNATNIRYDSYRPRTPNSQTSRGRASS